MAESAALLVDEILLQQPMRQWVLSVPFQLWFLFASQPAIMGKALGIVYRAISTHITKKAGYTKTMAHTGAVTLIQRFGSAINLNVHFHMLFLDSVYVKNKYGSAVRFQWTKSPGNEELARLTHTIAKRIGRYLERQGLLERLCRYIARPPVAEKRLSLTRNGMVRYELKTPYRDGTTHVIFEPLDFISKLAALVPKPRANLTRYHGVFAPNSKYRALVTPGRRGKGRKIGASDDTQVKSPEKRRASLNWAQRLKRVFGVDVEICEQCGGVVKVIACIEDPVVIKKILNHLDKKATTEQTRRPQSRAPPRASLFKGSPT